MIVAVEDVFYVWATETNIKTLQNLNKGQYHLPAGTNLGAVDFFSDILDSTPNLNGGWTKQIPIARFDGEDPVDARLVPFTYMGPTSARRDFNFPKQATDPYPLWAPARAFAGTPDDAINDLIAIVKDTSGAYHARWIRKADFHNLPQKLRDTFIVTKPGVWTPQLPNAIAHDELVNVIVEALRIHTNVLIYGPPATGKSHLINEVRKAFSPHDGTYFDTAKERQPFLGSNTLRDAWVTFHQSYSYEDFVVGLRPETKAGELGFSLRPHPGVLLELAEWSRQAGRESLLVIDEINRGNVSRIFGEFITLLEVDKRLDKNGGATETTVQIQLPYASRESPILVQLDDDEPIAVPHPFTMPAGMYTLATMNSVDKSVAPLDAALRRRFHIVALRPDFTQIESVTAPEATQLGITLLRTLNERLSGFLGPEFEFGQWFLSPVINAPTEDAGRAALASVWTNQVFPQLEEHFAGRYDQLLSVLAISSSSGPIEIVIPSQAAEGLGATRYIRLIDVDTPDLIEFLRTISTSVH